MVVFGKSKKVSKNGKKQNFDFSVEKLGLAVYAEEIPPSRCFDWI